jgi:type VI secretion system lysozyme-like protein
MDGETGGVRALLFERLSGCGPGSPPEPRPFRVHDGDSLRESVAREVSRLLNSRVAPPVPGPGGRTVLDYGLADWTHALTLDTVAHAALEVQVRCSLHAFEPRLRHVKVHVEPTTGRERALIVHVHAMLVVEGGEEPFSFPVTVGGMDGSA